MRISFAALSCLLLVVSAAQPSSAGNVGLGVIAGEPTGLSLKTWLGDTSALDAAAGWSLGENEWLYLHVDYLHHRYDLHLPDLDEGVPYYFGIGGRVLLREGHDSRLGIRIPLGLDYVFKDSRFDVFVEIAPIVNLIPDTELGLSGGVGARFWFRGRSGDSGEGAPVEAVQQRGDR
ncbi:MAG: hypothetical protein ABIG03_01260 [Candidatus Eisenbacteria bacterium]